MGKVTWFLWRLIHITVRMDDPVGRKTTGEATTFPRGAGDFELGAVPGHDVLDYGQTQSGAAGSSGGVHPIETLRQPGQIFPGNARPIIRYVQPRPARS